MRMVLEILQYEFMRNAVLAGLIITFICATLGVFLVLKRLSLIGDGLSHIAFGGIALGLFVNFMPFLVALVFSVVSSFGIVKLREHARVYGDTAIGIVFSTALAFGVVLISLAHGFTTDLHTFLFGNIISVTFEDLAMAGILGGLVLVLLLAYRNQFMFLCFDEKSARAAGVPVKTLNTLLILLTAVTVVISIRIVGILLISSFLIIPPATALQLARSFQETFLYSIGFGLLALCIGLLSSFYLDIASGGAIILASAGLFFAAAAYRKIRP